MQTQLTQNRIRILYTSDVHGKIYPYSYADGAEEMWGLARLKTLIDSLRDDKTIVIDNGDVLEGSPLTYYHYRNHREEVCPVTRAMSAIGYDYINIGNHDFNFGLDALSLHIKETGATCLTSNVVRDGTPLAEPYVVREIAGRRIAFFGVTTQFVPHWESLENIRGVTFPGAFDTAWDTVRLIRATRAADYIVCVYHGGLECARSRRRRLPRAGLHGTGPFPGGSHPADDPPDWNVNQTIMKRYCQCLEEN